MGSSTGGLYSTDDAWDYYQLTTVSDPTGCFLGYQHGQAGCRIVPYRLTGAAVARGGLVTNGTGLVL
jgi:hypothetical protein